MGSGEAPRGITPVTSTEPEGLPIPIRSSPSEHRLHRALGPVKPDHDRHRRDHRRRHFRDCGHRGRPACRTGRADLLCYRRRIMPLRRLCYAEFASLIPESGSAYTYAYATHGPLHGLVHRLEHGAGISRLGFHRGGWLVGLFRQPAAQSWV